MEDYDKDFSKVESDSPYDLASAGTQNPYETGDGTWFYSLKHDEEGLIALCRGYPSLVEVAQGYNKYDPDKLTIGVLGWYRINVTVE